MATPDKRDRRLRLAVKVLWWLTGAAAVFAIHPIIVGMIGAEMNDQRMMTYLWLTFIMAPIGVVIGLATGAAAIILQSIRSSPPKDSGSA